MIFFPLTESKQSRVAIFDICFMDGLTNGREKLSNESREKHKNYWTRRFHIEKGWTFFQA